MAGASRTGGVSGSPHAPSDGHQHPGGTSSPGGADTRATCKRPLLLLSRARSARGFVRHSRNVCCSQGLEMGQIAYLQEKEEMSAEE